ncbi:MAG: thiol oxidoreductase, partial [Anaerolineae bacterium]|nr:thiol oxidoreductase [Anaerolineae bacterium]
METGIHPTLPALSNQTIRPYTDLLLHDMGAGLADNRPDFQATGSEWRTPPLWGIGLFETVNKHSTYLHDGRARNLPEAILWHGGEAETAKDAFTKMSQTERDALIAFLKSL